MIYTNVRHPNTKLLVRYYDSEKLCSIIYVDFVNEIVHVENHTTQLWKTAFGENDSPSLQNFFAFLESRCVPRSRAGVERYLKSIGVSQYDPIPILQKTQGKMAEDNQWLEMEFL